MNQNKIILKNVRVHNLKEVDVCLEPSQLIAFTGVSGSGKSSLAFDTLYMEGQRRYVESLSTYARRHLGRFPKPDADLLEGISPTIAIEQKTTGKNPRSSVGTLTGIYDFLRVLFARIATPYCPISQEPVSPQSTAEILSEINSYPEGSKLLILSPYATRKKGEFKDDFAELLKKGFTRIRLDQAVVDLTDELSLDGSVVHDIDLVIDRIVLSKENGPRIIEAVQTALDLGKGLVKILEATSQEERLFSLHAYSKKSGLSYPPLEPQDFSFNHPQGMCSTCQGLGISQEFDLNKILDFKKSIAEDCCKIASSFETIRYGNIYANLAKTHKCDIKAPFESLPKKMQQAFLYGNKEPWTKMTFSHPSKRPWTEYVSWKGVLHEAKERYIAAKSDVYKRKMQEYFYETICPECRGSRIKPYPSCAKLHTKTIHEITSLPVTEAISFFCSLSLKESHKLIADEMVKEIIERLFFLQDVGLGYLSLDRTSPSLSGGESQRVRLASQIGSGLVGSTYILDEPSIGLHPRDNQKLIQTLVRLKEKGNTVIVVEHDEDTICCSDYIVDVGPLAGKNGGHIVAQGSLQDIVQSESSLTGGYLSGRLLLPPSRKRKPAKQKHISLTGARHHNLKNASVTIPLGLFVSVTGVSGSGKSSLILDTFYPAFANAVQGTALPTGTHQSIGGADFLDKVIAIDQSPIGRTPRSNPATYVKLFDEIRDLFTQLKESQALGFAAGRFSFNVQDGCCPFCQGMGMNKIDMDFLEEEWEVCSSCEGKRFDETTLSIRFKGKNIHDILEMTVEEAFSFFQDQPKIKKKLDLLMQVGLDYIQIGQPSPTLSGGEAQRIKLAKELSRPSSGKTLYILDEPTTGLHFHDVKNLILILQSLVDKGNTVCVIEHNMDLVKSSDWVIDLGQEAGSEGGTILFQGPPDKLARESTPTGLFLKRAMEKRTLLQATPLSAHFSTVSHLTVRGAAQNNLKNCDANIPLGKITVCTGPSGSGKSSFAFETIYAEGQRRYTESMSHYARQFIKQMPKPKVDQVEGLSAAIAIEQKNHVGNPRSTLGTMTEIYDYLRILYSHLGTPFCPETGERIQHVSKEYVADQAMAFPSETKLLLLSPISPSKKDSFHDFKDKLIKQGFLRIRLNGELFELEDKIPFDPKKKNELFLVVDRLILSQESRKRILEGVEQAVAQSKNQVSFSALGQDHHFHLAFTAPSTGKSYPPITPHTFSFNTEHGMCVECQGLGFQYGVKDTLIEELSSFSPLDLIHLLCKDYLSSRSLAFFSKELSSLGISPMTPLSQLSQDKIHLFFQGSSHWKGINPLLIQYTKSSLGNIHYILSLLLQKNTCSSCLGSRLSPLARNVKIKGVSLPDLCQKNLAEAHLFLSSLSLEGHELLHDVLKQIQTRLSLLLSIGLGYLSLDRGAQTLSGGETQRVRLSKQLGSGLSGCLYVLDEPTIGLHPYDNHLLNQALKQLNHLGNTLILVEHDPLTIQIADYILDFGPGSGKQGGDIIAQGSLQEILQDKNSLTGAYLSGRKRILPPLKRRIPKGEIFIENASLHNLNDLSLSIPTGVLCSLTGVSGSGKSTLLMRIVRKEAERALSSKRKKGVLLQDSSVKGLDSFDKLIVLDQNPAGTTNRADISTYTDLLTPLRYLYASLPEAKARGLQAKHFSHNHKKGMCSSCFGLGSRIVSLQFLPSVRVPCDACRGLRLNPHALNVSFKGKSLGEVLLFSVEQAQDFFSSFPKIVKILDTLISVGLGYLLLGQEIATLSGGESQRLRLSCELAKRSTGKTLYLFDEPSIGLHSLDIEKLVLIFQALVDRGNTVLLIEHNLDLIAQCDYLIDIGPGPGIEGGQVVCRGTPEEVALSSQSKTAPFLKEHLLFLKS